MALITDATITLYTLEDVSQGTSTSGNLSYPITGIPAGSYYYEITKSGKGTIIDFIDIPEDYDTGVLIKTLNLDMYDASPATTLTIQDSTSTAITGLDVKVKNIDLVDAGSGTYTSSVIPQTNCLIELNTSNTTYEPYKDSMLFPISGNALTKIIYPAFKVVFIFEYTNTGTNTLVTSFNIRYVYTDSTYSDWILITKSADSYELPITTAHQGDIEISLVTYDSGYKLATGEDTKTITGTISAVEQITVTLDIVFALS